MSNLIALILLVIFSSALVGLYRSWAIRHQILDVPNHRSSHSCPTPRGGGLAIVVTFLLALVYLGLSGQLESRTFWALGGGGILIASLGYRDDCNSLSAKTRLFGHLIAAVWATILIDGIPCLELGFSTWEWDWVGYVVSVFGIVWLVNLFNFMDGIDGLAASEALFAAGVGGLLLFNAGADGLALVSLGLAAGCAGFLFWNWPPAKIFMGDVCSGFLGYILGVLAIVSAQKTTVSLWIWLLLLSVFIVDATVTLIRRLLRREQVYEAHRSHAYQHATTLLGSHLKVTLGVVGINFLGLLPLVLITWNWPGAALVTTATAAILLTALALHFHAGVETNKEVDPSTFSAPPHSEINPVSS